MKDETLIWILVIAGIFWYMSKQDTLPPTTQPTTGSTGSVRDSTASIIHDAGDLVQSILDLFKQSSSSSYSDPNGSAQER